MVLATQGARVFVACPRSQVLDGVEEFAVVVRCDLTSVAGLDNLYDTVCSERGSLDVLLVGADTSARCDGSDGGDNGSCFDLIFNRQTRGVFFAVQKGLRFLAKDATLAVALPSGENARVGSVGLAKTRAAIQSFLQTWRIELARADIDIRPLEHGGADLRWLIERNAGSEADSPPVGDSLHVPGHRAVLHA